MKQHNKYIGLPYLKFSANKPLYIDLISVDQKDSKNFGCTSNNLAQVVYDPDSRIPYN